MFDDNHPFISIDSMDRACGMLPLDGRVCGMYHYLHE